MGRYSIKPGGLLVEKLPNRSFTPAWCSHLRDPVVHSMRLLWAPRFDYHNDAEEETEDEKYEPPLKSPSFSFEQNWLKGNLATGPTPCYRRSIYLKVAPGLEKRVQGMVRIASTSLNEVDTELKIPKEYSEFLFSPANYTYGSWSIGSFTEFVGKDKGIAHLIFDFVILDHTPLSSDCCHTQLIDDFSRLLVDKDTTDITIKVGSSELGVHKLVLGTRSPVLKAMLGADMVEGRTGVIELTQLSAAAAEAFVNFIYTAQIGEGKLTETAEELLVAASMYDMPDLKAVCETALCGSITVNNTARILLLASLHDAAQLKSETLDFFLKNKCDVIGTEEWKVAVADNSKLFLEALLAVI